MMATDRGFDNFLLDWEKRVQAVADPPARAKVLEEIAIERRRQDAKWGQQDHSPSDWLAILGEEFGEIAREITESISPGARPLDRAKYRSELIDLAAVAVQAIESFDRQAARAARQEER